MGERALAHLLIHEAINHASQVDSNHDQARADQGVHPRRLAMVAKLLIDAAERGSTQFIVNTHSPFLPQYFMGVDAACILHCRRAGRRTVFEPLEAALPSFEQQVEAALNDEYVTPFSERVVRGDFGG